MFAASPVLLDLCTALNMRVPEIAVACSLLIMAATASAQQLDPIINFCIRFDHQCR